MSDLSDGHQHLHLVPLGVLRLDRHERLLLAPRRKQRLVPGRPPLEGPVAEDEVDTVLGQLDLLGGSGQVDQLVELSLNFGQSAGKRHDIERPAGQLIVQQVQQHTFDFNDRQKVQQQQILNHYPGLLTTFTS